MGDVYRGAANGGTAITELRVVGRRTDADYGNMSPD
jgi:hypothetical protein